MVFEVPIARTPTITTPGARYYRPRWVLRLAVPVEAVQSAKTSSASEIVHFQIPVSKFTLVRNNHNEADTLEVTADWHYAGVDPRLLQSATGWFFIGEAALGATGWTPTAQDLRFVGVMKRAKRIGSTDSGLTVEILLHDYTAFFLEQKSYPPSAMPEYWDTLSSAWEKICDNTGPIDPATLGDKNPKIISLVSILRGVSNRGGPGLVFQGCTDAPLGGQVAARIRQFGKLQVHPDADAWAIWSACVGHLGLITYIRGEQCIVTTATDYYSVLSPVHFVWGTNIKTLNEERESHITGKAICIRSFNTLTGTTIEGFYPPIGDNSASRKKGAAGHARLVSAADFEVYTYPYGAGTQAAVDDYARRTYEEFVRQEYAGKLTTHELRVDGSNAYGPVTELLDLYDGDALQVEVDRADLAALGQFHSDDAKVSYLVSKRGYDENVARLVVLNLNGILSRPALFIANRVQIEAETTPEGGSFQFEVGFVNVIDPDGGAR